MILMMVVVVGGGGGWWGWCRCWEDWRRSRDTGEHTRAHARDTQSEEQKGKKLAIVRSVSEGTRDEQRDTGQRTANRGGKLDDWKTAKKSTRKCKKKKKTMKCIQPQQQPVAHYFPTHESEGAPCSVAFPHSHSLDMNWNYFPFPLSCLFFFPALFAAPFPSFSLPLHFAESKNIIRVGVSCVRARASSIAGALQTEDSSTIGSADPKDAAQALARNTPTTPHTPTHAFTQARARRGSEGTLTSHLKS